MCGGGVLAGVEQSCNELILERESERARPNERTDDLVELGYNNNPGLGKCWDKEDKGSRGNIYFFFCCFHLPREEGASSSHQNRAERRGIRSHDVCRGSC